MTNSDVEWKIITEPGRYGELQFLGYGGPGNPTELELTYPIVVNGFRVDLKERMYAADAALKSAGDSGKTDDDQPTG